MRLIPSPVESEACVFEMYSPESRVLFRSISVLPGCVWLRGGSPMGKRRPGMRILSRRALRHCPVVERLCAGPAGAAPPPEGTPAGRAGAITIAPGWRISFTPGSGGVSQGAQPPAAVSYPVGMLLARVVRGDARLVPLDCEIGSQGRGVLQSLAVAVRDAYGRE